MAATEKRPSMTLDQAVAQLKRDPIHPVRARVGELEVELRVVGDGAKTQPGLGDLMAVAGPWEGESTEELINILSENLDAGAKADVRQPVRQAEEAWRTWATGGPDGPIEDDEPSS